jgi:thiol-disulfide isomerase/thioredoxin
MVRTASTMLPLGTPAPKLDSFQGKPTVVMFLCNHCPYVKHVAPELAKLSKEYMAKGIAFLGISSNDASAYPDDAPEKMGEEAARQGYSFPYLYDADQSIARAYRAACTPDIFVFDHDHHLVYRGQLDDSRPKNSLPLTGRDLRDALDAVLAGQPVSADQKPSIGCNIKWREGAEPEYFNPTGVS